MAARGGDVPSQEILGLMQVRGMVGATPSEGLVWLKKAAEAGSASAMSNLGIIYLQGPSGIPVQRAEALKWLLESAKHGDADAANRAAIMLLQGQGVPQDPSRAVTLLKQAAHLGHPQAQANLKRLLGASP